MAVAMESNPGQQYLPAFNKDSNNKNELIQSYFHLGFEYKEIALFLAMYHGITISIRHLKRILKTLGLKRQGYIMSDSRAIIGAIENELVSSGNCLGYRQMHQRLRNDYHLQVDRETVRIAMGVLDPDGILRRKKHRLIRRKYCSKRKGLESTFRDQYRRMDVYKGPNYSWHIDGYDKLKPYGFCIHGCIDGYSRRIMWLKVASTNNNPAVVAQYYIDCIKAINGAPRLVRADHGTENVNIEVLQNFFHDNGDEGTNFRYGKSVSNQRIEAWWSYFRKTNADFWINYFKDLRDCGLFDDSDLLESSCLKFCFMGLLQQELDRVSRHWNTHHIRPYPNQQTPPGRPDVLYSLSESRGIQDYKVYVNLDDAELAEEYMAEQPLPFGCFKEFSDVFLILMQENNLVMPHTVNEAEELFLKILQLTSNII